MKILRLLLLAVLVAAVSSAQQSQVIRSPRASQSVMQLSAQHQTIVRAIYENAYKYVPAPSLTDHPATATFVVTYNGFTPPAQAAFQYAVDIWASLLTSPVPIHVTANWTPLAPGVRSSS